MGELPVRGCPKCRGPFIMSGLRNTQVDLNPAAPIEVYDGKSPGVVSRCPHCGVDLTSDAFPGAGMSIPYDAPMLESDAQDVAEGSPLELPTEISTKVSQDNIEEWVETAGDIAWTKAYPGDHLPHPFRERKRNE